MEGIVTGAFIGDYTECGDLRPLSSRVARQTGAGGTLRGTTGGGSAMAAQVQSGRVDRRLYCRFDPTSETCRREGAGSGQVRSVARFTNQAQQQSFRSVERATEANVRRLDSRSRAVCDRLVQEVAQ